MNNTTKISVANITLYNFLSRIVYFVFLFGVSVYNSRVLDAGTFGKIQYINFSIMVLWTIFSLGAPALLQRYFAEAFQMGSVHRIQQLKRIWIWSVLLSVALGSIAWFTYGYIAGRPVHYLVLLLMISQFIAQFAQVAAQATFRYTSIALGNILICIVAAVFIYTWVPALGIDGYLYAIIALHTLLACWYLILFFTARTSNLDTQTAPIPLREWMTQALRLALSTLLAAVLWQRTELYFIRHTEGFESLATYSVALSVLAFSMELFRILPGAMMGYFAAHQQHMQTISERYIQFLKLMIWMIAFVAVFVSVNANMCITILYTHSYESAAPLLRILLVGYSFGALSFLTMQLHIGLGKTAFMLMQDAGAAIVVILGCVWFIPIWGIAGAAFVKSIAVALTSFAGFVYHWRQLRIGFPVRHMLLCILMALVVIVPVSMIPANTPVLFLVSSIVALIGYFMVGIQFKLIDAALIKRSLRALKPH